VGTKKKYDHLESGYIDETNIFGGSKRIISPSEFKGGKVTNIFGGSEINLTQTTLSEGKNVLDVTCMFGGVKIIVPSDWKVFVKVDAIMGGFDDKRMNIKADHDSTKELYIKGLALFGGGELKSY